VRDSLTKLLVFARLIFKLANLKQAKAKPASGLSTSIQISWLNQPPFNYPGSQPKIHPISWLASHLSEGSSPRNGDCFLPFIYLQKSAKTYRLAYPNRLTIQIARINRQNSTQILQQPISSIYLQISCLDKRAEGGNGEATKQSRKVIIPVLVKVLDLNDNAPKFSSPIYTVSVNELTPLDSIVIDSIQAVDLDSANNGLVEYSLAGAMTTTEPKDPVESNLSPQARLVQRAQPETQAVISTAAPSATLPTVSGEPQIRGSTANGGLNLEPSNDLPATESAVSAIVNSTSKSEPTINLESEPILNGPVEEGEEEESDESLLASMNSTDSEADFDSAILTRATARRSRRRRRHSVSFRQHTPATTSNPEFSSSSTGARLAGETTKSRDLWTNLLAASAGDEMLAAERYNGLELANGLGATNNKLTEATFADEHFALELAPHTNRPVIRLKKQLDYESKRVHLLTIRATDMAPNKQERLSSMATIVVRVLDGDDQGPAFVLDQGGCATGSVPQTTASSLLVAPDRWPQGASVGGEQLQEAESMVSTSGQVVAPKSRPAANPGDQALDLGGSNSPTRATTKLDRHLPKGFRVTEDNFEFGDSSSSDDSDGDHQLLSAIHQPETWGQAGRARRFPPLANAEANSPAQTTRAPPATRSTKSRQPDYTCLSSSPVLSGQAEYFATVMSGDSDYLLRIAPQAIRARDRDELNAPIRYSFVNGTPNHFGQYFQINPLDASIKQVAPVDRAQVGKFIIWIQAQEQNANKLSSTAKLTIDVIPTDKNPPVLVPNSYSGFIEENSPIGSNVAITADPKSRNTSSFLRINVVDADYSGSSQANPVTIPLAQLYEFDTTSDAFKVDKEGFLYVNQWPLDRDPPNQEVHIFQVTARQIGLASSRSISSPVSINVTLLDLNDNPPLISNASLVQLQLAATNGATRTLTTIKTTDKDLPENAKVHFSIHHVSNNGRDRFRINEESGELQALGKFNSGEQFSITVQVSDDLGRSSQGILDMLVVPGPNTGGPQFVVDSEHDNSRGYSVEVNEGVAPHSAILQVQARDPENDPIAYSIVDGNVNNDFYINSKTGIIYVANKLDREEVSAYNLLVQARDSGGLASNRPVSITISDNNDQNPVFERSQYAFSIEEGAVAGRIVGRVAAFDSDSGENGQISYSLELSPTSTLDGRPLFTIDEQTGEIRVVESLDYEQARVHTLIVIAKDHGENPRSTTASVQVRVVDVQDEQPYFERYYIETRLEENLGKHRVAQVQARDPDSETQISYVLKAGDSSLFAVDAQTGIVSTIRGLDFEESRAHSLLVGTLENQESDLVAVANLLDASLSSGLTMQKSPVCRIDITVVDLNDNEPQFVSQMLPVRIQDSAQLGTVVANVSAIDRDASQPNNQVRYELVGREDPLEVAATTSDQCAQSFMIDPTSGSVSVKSDLKRDSQSECQLVIRARDLGQQPKSLSSTSSLTIFIDHIAEISHSSMIGFADSSFTVELEENSAPNSLVKILPVVNKPKINFPLSCEIVNGNELGKFYVVENELRDCELRTGKQVIDYEIKQRYMLTLRLNTIGSGAKNLAHVNINILDKNDNRPIFSQPARYSHLTANRFLAAIASDAPSETQVLQLRASDLDSAHSNGLVSYELLNDSELDGRFKVDPIDGILRTSRPVEDVPRTRLPMRLRVLARDNPEQPSDSLESVAEVIVNLIDDRHRMALALNDAPTGRVLDSKDEILR